MRICWMSTCRRQAKWVFQSHVWCDQCLLSFQAAMGTIQLDIHYRNQRRNLPQVSDREAHEVATAKGGPRWANPPRYRQTHRGHVRECSGGLPSLGKDQ